MASSGRGRSITEQLLMVDGQSGENEGDSWSSRKGLCDRGTFTVETRTMTDVAEE